MGGDETSRWELLCDPGPDCGVLRVPTLKLSVSSTHEVVHCLGEVGEDILHEPFDDLCGCPRRPCDVCDQIRIRLSEHQRTVAALGEIGKESARFRAEDGPPRRL